MFHAQQLYDVHQCIVYKINTKEQAAIQHEATIYGIRYCPKRKNYINKKWKARTWSNVFPSDFPSSRQDDILHESGTYKLITSVVYRLDDKLFIMQFKKDGSYDGLYELPVSYTEWRNYTKWKTEPLPSNGAHRIWEANDELPCPHYFYVERKKIHWASAQIVPTATNFVKGSDTPPPRPKAGGRLWSFRT